jgi:hypothetical protein
MLRPLPFTVFQSLLLIALLAILSLSCRGFDDRPGSGSSGLIKQPANDLTGDWSGSWDTTAGFPLDSGTVVLRIRQDEDASITGTSEWIWKGDNPLDHDDPADPMRCWEESQMKEGFVDGNKLSRLKVVELLANAAGQGLVVLRAEFVVSGQDLLGTFKVESFTDSNDRCTLEVTRLDNSGVIVLTKVPGS